MKTTHLFNKIKTVITSQKDEMPANANDLWNRLENRLDHQIVAKKSNRYQKIFWGATIPAAAVLLFFFFNKNNEPNVNEKPIDKVVNYPIDKNVKVEQTAEKINEIILPKFIDLQENQVVIHEDSAVLEKTNQTDYFHEMNERSQNEIANQEGFIEVTAKKTILNDKELEKAISKTSYMQPTTKEVAESKAENMFYEQVSTKSKEIKTKKIKQKKVRIKKPKKENLSKKEPLLVINGQATKYSVHDFTDDELEDIVFLDEPLYIINGVEYTEDELFGPKPTSPYYPLKDQNIEEITIYEAEKAIEKYGQKGTKGVVVIKTKDGKPVK
jgi:hypothetical protein